MVEANRLRSLDFAERSAELNITSVAIAADGFAEDSGYEAAGEVAVDQLMAQIEGGEANDRILVPGIAVVEREST